MSFYLFAELRSLRDLRIVDTWEQSDSLNVSQYIENSHAILEPDLQNIRRVLIFVRWAKIFLPFHASDTFWQTMTIFLVQAHQIGKSDRFKNWVLNFVKMSSFRTFETRGGRGRCLGRGWVSYFISGSDKLTSRLRPRSGGNTRSIVTFSRTPSWIIIRISHVTSHFRQVINNLFLPLVKSAFMLSWAQGLTRDHKVTHIVKGQWSSFDCPQVLTR